MLENLIDEFVRKLIAYYDHLHLQQMSSQIHVMLVLEGNFDLINKLHRIERKESGYGTIVVPKQGFSKNDDAHNLILDWLHAQNVNVLNVQNEIANLEYALHGD